MKSKLVFLSLVLFCCLFVSCQSKPEDHYNSAIALAKNNDYKLAIKELDEAIAQKSDYAQAYLERGKYRLANQDYSEANGDTSYLSKMFSLSVKDFTDAMKYDTNLTKEAILGRGNCYFILKSYKNAITDFNNLLKSDSTNKQIIGVLVWSKLYMKDTVGAKDLLDRVIALAPNDAENYYGRAMQRLLSFNNKVGACEDLNKAEALYSDKEKYLVKDLIGNIKVLQKINCNK
ncbi:MAG: tetratricopeptide repeat protein [Bacteroidota bacterium]